MMDQPIDWHKYRPYDSRVNAQVRSQIRRRAGAGGVMKKSFGVTHCMAECRDCDWRTESYKNGQAIAALHAIRHGHYVKVEVGIAGCYDGRGAELVPEEES